MQSNSAVRSLVALGVSIAASFCSVALFAATASAQQYKIAQVVYENPGPFTQEQLAAVSGVKPGDPATAATLQAGAQKLSDSGFFDDIGAEIRGTTAHLIAAFQLKPTPRAAMIAVGYENFVWLTPQEIDAAIHAGMPLYFGALQENTVQVDQVNAALVQALAAKGVVAKVEHETIEPTLEHPLRAMEFRVVSPRPVVANIKLAGATPNLVPLLQSSVNTTAHTPYNAGLSGRLTAESILAPLLDAGYIDAALGSVTLEAGALDKSLGLEPVVVNAKLSPGDVYHLSSITFAGSPLMTADAFNAGAKLHLGDTASRMQLLLTLAPLDTAYRKQGYMDVIIKADPKEDAAAHTVAYTVTVTPGEQYRLAKVTAEGLDPTAQADFEKYFKLKTGDIYDPTYVATFIKSNTALKSLATYTGTFKAYADPNKHTVELVLKFFAGPTITVH
jgi:outer membrane protein insertion porin family